jgi:PAS domain S-box-containing protein
MAEIRILYIEEEETQRRKLASSLAERGFDISAQSNGVAALAELRKSAFDLVLCNLNLSDIGGLELLARIRESNPSLPFLLLAARDSINAAVTAIRQGADNYLLKPFSIEEVEICIHQALERAQLLQKLEEKSKQLEGKTIELARANVDLLGIQEELQKIEEQIRLIVETSPVPTIVSRLDDGKIVYANEGLARLVGVPKDKLVGQMTPDFYHRREDRELVVAALRRDGFLRDFEVQLVRPDGQIIWSNMSLAVTKLAGEVVIIGGVSDITARKEAEEKLHLYRQLYLASVDSIVILDKAGRYIESNPAHLKATGMNAEQLESIDILSLLGIDPENKLRSALLEGKSCRFEIRPTQSATGIKVAEISAYPIRNDDDEIVAYAGIGRDVSAQRLAQETLATRARYEEGLAACSQALLTERDQHSAIEKALLHLLESTDTSRVYLYEMAEGAKDMLESLQTHEVCAEGIEPQMDNPDMQTESVRQNFQDWTSKLQRGEHVGGLVRNFPDDQRELLEQQDIVSILVLPLMIEGKCAGFIGFDDCRRERVENEEDLCLLRTAAEIIGSYLTAKRVEEALRVSEERFRHLVENVTDVIYSVTPDGRFSYLSPQFTEVTGYRPEEFIGRPVRDLQPHSHKEEPHESWLEDVFSGKVDRVMDDQFSLTSKTGEERWFVSNMSVVRDEEGQVVEFIGVAHDITEMQRVLEDLERTNKELRNTQSQLVQSEKMASLGQLVAGIAHEINTPIGALSSMHNTQVRAYEKLSAELKSRFAEECANNRALKTSLQVMGDANDVIANATQRVTTIVRRLRSFARLDEAELKTVDLHEGIEDTLTLIHHEIKHAITIKRDFGKLPPLSCFPGRLNQVFLNLLNNARQAIKDEGEIAIRTFMRGGRACIEISDTGSGIKPENLKKVFDPGFTTKGVGVGTGLGLSICFQIIADHQGEIKVASELGEGTTFTITLPTDLDKRLGVS